MLNALKQLCDWMRSKGGHIISGTNITYGTERGNRSGNSMCKCYIQKQKGSGSDGVSKVLPDMVAGKVNYLQIVNHMPTIYDIHMLKKMSNPDTSDFSLVILNNSLNLC